MSLTRADLKRRDLLRAAALAGIAGSPVLTACATPDPVSSEPAAQGKISAANPLGVPRDKPVEIVIFDGGFGDEYATRIHEPLLTVRHAGLQVKHVATKEISKTLQPRFAGGNPPEVVNNDGADEMDLGALSADGQMADLTPLLEAPAWDQPGKKVRTSWSRLRSNAARSAGSSMRCTTTWSPGASGTPARCSSATAGSRRPRGRHSWRCANRSRSLVSPLSFTYAGKHPEYVLEPLLTTAAKAGGLEVLKNIDNLADGAWLAEPVRQAAAAWQEIGAKYAAGHRRHQPHRVPGQAEHR